MQHIQDRRLTTRLQAPIVTIQESRQVIGERMREARLNCGLSQGNIAEMLHSWALRHSYTFILYSTV